MRPSLLARLLACVLMPAGALTIIQPADAAVPDRNAWVLWNQTAGDCNYMVNGISQLKPALKAAADQLAHLKK